MRLEPLLALAAALACLLTALPASATIERFALIVGNNRGETSHVELRYAESDAERMYDVLKDVGFVSPANMILLRGDDASVARRALVSLNDRIRSAVSRPDTEAMLFVFYSGHADALSLRMNDSAFDLRELEELVRGSAATFRLLVLDACRSGSLTRVKGGFTAAPFLLPESDGLAEQGVVFLTSSSASEDAQESDEIRSSFFTHFFASGLLGAADGDGDGRVQLDEAYRYAYDATLRATSRTLAGTQHPTYRYELRGQGKVVLTEPGRARTGTALVFPSGRSYLVTRGGPNGAVVGEVAATAPSRRLSVRPDTYFVRGRAAAFYVEGEMRVGTNQVAEVRDEGLQRFAYARLVRKGEGERRQVHGLRAGYTFRTPVQNASTLCQGAFVGYAFSAASFSLAARLHGCTSSFENRIVRATADEAGATLALSHAWDVSLVTIDLGLSLGASVLHQQFVTAGTAPSRSTFAGASGVHAGLSADLGGGVSIFAEERAETYLFDLQRDTGRTSLTPSLAFRQLLGLAKDW